MCRRRWSRARHRVPHARGAPAGLPGAALRLRLLEAGRRGLPQSLHDEHGLPYTICRPFNAYGPGATPDDEPGIARGPRRDPQGAGGRPAVADLRSASKRARSRTWTTSPTAWSLPWPTRRENEDFNVSRVGGAQRGGDRVGAIWEARGRTRPQPELEHLPSFEVDVQRRWPSVEKAERLLGWRARIDLREGIAGTVEWLREREPARGGG